MTPDAKSKLGVRTITRVALIPHWALFHPVNTPNWPHGTTAPNFSRVRRLTARLDRIRGDLQNGFRSLARPVLVRGLAPFHLAHGRPSNADRALHITSENSCPR